MHWYDGSIGDAVKLSKQNDTIFVVFVEDNSDLSKEMATTIDDTVVVSRLSNQTNFLAVKLMSGTTNYTHFAQIYQFVPVPSLFFIGRNGTPLEVVCAGVQASNLASRIDKLLAEHHGQKYLSQPSTSSSSQGLHTATADFLQSEANASAPMNIPGAPKTDVAPETPNSTKDDFEVVCDGDVCVRRPKTADQPSTSQSPAVTPATPVVTPVTPVTPAVAPSVIPPAERQKELERRNVDVAEQKRLKAEQEMKQIQEERKREKREDNLARQRILEQIAQDRAERRARDNPPAPQMNISQLPKAPSPPKIAKPTESTLPETPKPTKDDFELVCDGDVCVRRPKTADQPSISQSPAVTPATPVVTPPTPVVTPATPEVTPATPVAVEPPVFPPVANVQQNIADARSSDTSVDEKLERAKELIEAKRKEKAEQEKELERQKELERRNTGQGVAELKRWQADQDMKNIQEERKREKLENNLARQRILEQIAQDRAERRARDNTAPAPVPQPTPSPAQQQTTSHLPTSGDAGTSARVQFKLPDGTSHTAHFDATGTLGEVQRYVADNLQLSESSFALWTAFPRRELTAVSASLRELQLAPSAALLVLPRRADTPTSGPKQYTSVYAFITQLLTTFLYQPSLALFTWLRNRLSPPPAVAPPPPPPNAAQAGPVPRAGPLPRRRTNIHRLPGDSANDDDNNTWNGNSTQQM